MLSPSSHFLNPRRKLVDEVADWLCGQDASASPSPYPGRLRRDSTGAASLAHVCVVVPTAQSGRNLRLALARRFEGRGLVPPMVAQPMSLARGSGDDPSIAPRLLVGAAFLKFIDTCGNGVPASRWPHLFLADSLSDHDALLSFLDQFEDLWRLLGAGGLTMRDVPLLPAAAKILQDAQGDESLRWAELADFEAAFFSFLHDLGLRHESERLAAARTSPPDLPAEIEEVVLPALADPVPLLEDLLAHQRTPRRISVLLHADKSDAALFDTLGRPLAPRWTGSARPSLPLDDDSIICASTNGRLARRIANDFPDADSVYAPPSLGLCDETLFNDLTAAFLAKGYELHNPEKFRLSASSLGRIANHLLSLHAAAGAAYPWDDFTAIMREDDIPLPCPRHRVLEGLDICRNAFFPSVLPSDCHFDIEHAIEHAGDRQCAADFLNAAKSLRARIETARRSTSNAADFLRAAFLAIYEGRVLDDGSDDREFAAAIGSLRDTLSQFDDAAMRSLGLGPAPATALLRKSLAAATFSLEPDSPNALMTAGWLELAWSDCDRIALAGLNEGAVPDSVSGHVFLPDPLRAALGLPSNDQRLARDTFLLKSLLESRAPGDVRAYFARTSDTGDIHRPSRLLFLVDDARLAARAKALFGESAPDTPRAPRRVAPAWRPRLPLSIPLPHAGEPSTPDWRLSASAIDKWLSCPLSYLLEFGLNMRRTEEKDELGFDNFGSLVHKALEAYAQQQLERSARGLPQLLDERDIRDAVNRIFASVRSAYGAAPSLKIRLQLDAAESRLSNFASLQAKWAEEGWRVALPPEFKFTVRPFAGEGDADICIHGSIDRIDFKEGVGYRIIDYKTWDDKGKAPAHILSSGGAEADFALALGLPTLPPARANAAPKRFLSIQLPLYRRCLEVADSAQFGGKVADCCYLVLGKNPENTHVFGSEIFNDPAAGAAALDTARLAIRAIRASLFWPPGPGTALNYGFGDIFLNSPESDLKGSGWLAAQQRRLTAFTKGGQRP